MFFQCKRSYFECVIGDSDAKKKKKRVKEDGTEIYIPQVFEAMSY